MSRDIEVGNLSGTANMAFSTQGTISARHEHTGRTIVADKAHALVDDWSKCATRTEVTAHQGFTPFDLALASPNLVIDKSLVCYRGLRFPRDATPCSLNMGPPSHEKAVAGRYNKAGYPVLYLSSSTDGVLRECLDDGRALWMQEFLVPSNNLRIIDTSASDEGSILNQVFWCTERIDVQDWSDKLYFSQLVAELIAERYDGMLVRGRRGEPGLQYLNVIIFRPSHSWNEWLFPAKNPIRIR